MIAPATRTFLQYAFRVLTMGQFGLGQGLRRIGDQRLLTGQGRYTDDIRLDGEAVGYVLRSPYAHAEIGGIEAGEARGVPGVLAIYTAEDILAAIQRFGLRTLKTAEEQVKISQTSESGLGSIELHI